MVEAAPDFETPTLGAVRAQYEALPYPPRDPGDEMRRLVLTSLDDLDALNHHAWRGRRDFRSPMRVLIVGGGSGDSTVYLAHQLERTPAEIVHLDMSEAAIDVARRRLQVRGLAHRVHFVVASLYDLPRLGLGSFDYINCSGVLHHLDRPLRGLRAIRSVLADGGAIGLMVYASQGRLGVYYVQELLRRLTRPADPLRERLRVARMTIDALGPRHPLRRVSGILPDLTEDSELQDMFLHAKDRAFTLDELRTFVAQGGLRIAAFSSAWRTFHDVRLIDWPEGSLARERIERMPIERRRSIAEMLWGMVATHECWLTRDGDTIARPTDEGMRPVFSTQPPARNVLRALEQAIADGEDEFAFDWEFRVGETLAAVDRLAFPLDPITRDALLAIDARRTIASIVVIVAEKNAVSHDEVRERFLHALAVLGRHDVVLLRHESSVRP